MFGEPIFHMVSLASESSQNSCSQLPYQPRLLSFANHPARTPDASHLISHKIVLGWHGFDETKVKSVGGWRPLVDKVLANESLFYETPRRPSDGVMRRVAADSRNIAQQEQRGAEQATMSLDSLYNVRKQNGAANGDLQSAIARLFFRVQHPPASNAPAFIAQLQKICAALGRGGAQAGK
jgi:hypothetical protein